jgi:hypothetical protein
MEPTFCRVLRAGLAVCLAFGFRIGLVRAEQGGASPRVSWWVEGRPWTCSDPVAPIARQAELACDASGGHCRIAETRDEADRIAAVSCAADRSAWRLDAEDRSGRVLWWVVLTGDPEARARKAGIWIARAEATPPPPPESERPPDAAGPSAAESAPESEVPAPSPPRAPAKPEQPEPADAEMPFRRLWIGGAGSFDLVAMPAATDVCLRNNVGTAPSTPGNPYSCADPSSGAAFPGSDAMANMSIARNGDLVGSGLAVGNVRLLVSIDYALTSNVLIGARAGTVLRTDPIHTGFSPPDPPFGPFHLEARATYLFGDRAILRTVAPLALVAVGVGRFDAYVSVPVFLNAYSVAGMTHPAQTLTENAWLTAGPAFVAAGGGVRFLLPRHVALTLALKLEAAFGGTANTLVGGAPELGLALGF